MKRIVISRVDAIGDVILTLPCAGAIKEHLKDSIVYFLGRTYTKEVVALSGSVDHFINWDDYKEKPHEFITLLNNEKIDTFIHIFPHKKIAKLVHHSNIKTKIGTTRRFFHFLTCNKKVSLSRKKSNLHESQLNLKLLSPLIGEKTFPLNSLHQLYNYIKPSPQPFSFLAQDKFNIILHPKSHGSAVEWGLDNFSQLIQLLHQSKKFNIIISGTKTEKKLIQKEILDVYKGLVIDTTGKLSLKEFINLISQSNGLVAASTGPLHIASLCGIKALGLYIDKKPIHPGRWRPIGVNAHFLIPEQDNSSIQTIHPNRILNHFT